MSPYTNYQINLLMAHTTLHRLAWGSSGLFSAVFMLRRGIAAEWVFLTFSGIFLLRYALRPLMLALVPAVGLRTALALGTLLQAAQYPMLAFLTRSSLALYGFGLVSSLAGVIYYTCYHTLFAIVGDVRARGRQVAIRQALGTGAAIAGPAIGGILLSFSGAWLAFGCAAVVELASMVPFIGIKIPRAVEQSKPATSQRFNNGVLLFASDGWINHGSGTAWNIILFQSLGTRFDAFGFVLAAAALGGALGGIILGRFIDLGHARGATRINAVVLASILLVKAGCGNDGIIVTVVAIVTYIVGGVYIPSLMTAFYNEAKHSADPLRFQISAEGGWDLGAAFMGVIAAALCVAGAPYQALIVLSLPAVLIQARVLERSYAMLQTKG